MSKTETKIPYADALSLAEPLVRRLQPGCERILIAGSLRRQKREVGDIELVAMPMLTPALDMFGEPVVGMEHSGLDERLVMLGTEGYTKNGPKYKQFIFGGASVDLFVATRKTWGCVATIRTGSAGFTHWLVTNRRHGGGCPSHIKFSEGVLLCGGAHYPTPEEVDVFAALEQPWIEPMERTEGWWRR